MEKVTIEEIRNVLMAFVKRASAKNAPPEEVEALPKVAQILLDTFC